MNCVSLFRRRLYASCLFAARNNYERLYRNYITKLMEDITTRVKGIAAWSPVIRSSDGDIPQSDKKKTYSRNT